MSQDEVHRQLLNVIGIPAEQHAEVIAMQQEIQKLHVEQRAAVLRNVNAVASTVSQALGLPEGYTFEYR